MSKVFERNAGDGNDPLRRMLDRLPYLKSVGGLATIAIAVMLIWNSVYIIRSGEVGVLATFGKYSEAVSLPGIHARLPIVQDVATLDIKLQTANYAGEQDLEDQEGIVYKPRLDVLDPKNVHYDIELTIQYTPVAERMPWILTNYGANYFEKIINPLVRDVVRDVGGKYNIETIADHRDAMNTEIEKRLAEGFTDLPFVFNGAALRQIVLPGSIMQKILAVQEAKQEEERLKIEVRQAEQTRQKTVTLAEAEKARTVIGAQAEAESITLRGRAQAEVNRRVAESLTPLLVQQLQVEKWNGQLPTTTLGNNPGQLLFQVK